MIGGRSERRRSWSKPGTILPLVSRGLLKTTKHLGQDCRCSLQDSNSYLDDVSLEVTNTLACSICSVKVNKSVNRKLRSSMRKEHVSGTAVKARAWESASSWQTNMRTSEPYMSLGPNCLVTDSHAVMMVMTTDYKEVTYRTFRQQQAHNKGQRLINE